ncbi:GntR family transcriptional regulator [Wujia chipingensis]|uniref:GntR family transcriptional regulator n=1 Tax=Wujia chipingensis TaxID=2763670 RepID=A0A7G9FLE7_9FIRM|nr:GntR family transcriptional regulator [Wujia chipingensis]QNL99378.1 GntR family transcriptional regulator [Wujia chipingensis]
MAWKFNNESPIYLQIVEIIKTQIAQGVLKPGDQVPAVRELAVTAGVNPNTMQKALAELEREGVLYSQRTAGRFVAEPKAGGGSLREELSKKHIQAYVDNMRSLGYADSEICAVLETFLKESTAKAE